MGPAYIGMAYVRPAYTYIGSIEAEMSHKPRFRCGAAGARRGGVLEVSRPASTAPLPHLLTSVVSFWGSRTRARRVNTNVLCDVNR
jgi:hypothetical protein